MARRTPKGGANRENADSEFEPGSVNLSGQLNFESPEPPDQRKARLAIEKKEAESKIRQDERILTACLWTSAGLGIVSVVALFFSPDPAVRGWAGAALSGLVTSYLGYFGGKRSK